ncbi:hypothetical protein NPIL_440931 [Nephila pilipes]|uniref:Uncharacterized protein n=1 Tax=Nephila pilipes TaxID=299642 RepID=A0A8X6TT48_NEPPI|nr:hypothetical protein NPIL_440931 [Nephila pilipes]
MKRKPTKPIFGIQSPDPLIFNNDFITYWKLFLQKWKKYAILIQLSQKKNKEYHEALFLHTLGEEDLKRHSAFKFENIEEDSTVNEIIEIFNQHIIG